MSIDYKFDDHLKLICDNCKKGLDANTRMNQEHVIHELWIVPCLCKGDEKLKVED